MSYETIKLEVSEGVAWLTIDRPSTYNAINPDVARELLDAANRCATDRSIRAVVLTGAGEKSFSSGGDIGAFAEHPEKIGTLMKEMTMHLHSAISTLSWMDAPLIAMVNGAAAGAGLSLVAASDLVIASESSKFASAYTHIGLSPDGSSTYFLPRVIGIRRTAELYLTNRTISAQEALSWGLVNEVVPAAELKNRVTTVASQFTKGPTKAYGAVKRLLQLSMNESLESQMEREGRSISELSMSEDGQEGVRAFRERRKPVFNGR